MIAFLIALALTAPPPQAHGCPTVDDGSYLREALRNARGEELPEVSRAQAAQIGRLVEGILQAARRHRWEASSKQWESLAAAIKPRAFNDVSELLTNPHSWVRGIALRALIWLDRRRSVPFVAALLTDEGGFDWMNDVIGNTIASEADGLAKSLVDGIKARVPLDELDCPGAKGRAVQRWIRFHLSYLEWQPHAEWGHYVYPSWPSIAAAPGADLFPAGLVSELSAEGEETFQWLYIWPKTEYRGPVYRRGDPVPFGLCFENAGKGYLVVRFDPRDAAVHSFRLVGPNGKTQLPRAVELPGLAPNMPPLQSAYGGHSRTDGKLAWFGDGALQLQKVFDLSEPGTYRLYYSYVPPEAHKRDPREYSYSTDLRFWDGRSYVNYYDFLIR